MRSSQTRRRGALAALLACARWSPPARVGVTTTTVAEPPRHRRLPRGATTTDGSSEGSASPTTASSGTTTGSAAPQGDPVTGGELTIGNPLTPSNLDPISGGSGGDHQSLYPMFDRLVNFEPETLEPLPGLATAWDYPDPQTLVLTLQDGVTFHDGTPFDAAAVKYNLDRALTLETSTVKADLSMIGSVDATAPDTVTIHLNRPDSSLLLILADRPGMMVSPTAVEAAGAEFGRQPVGAGPYTFVEYLPSDRLVLKKNPNYWQEGKPYLDQITFRYIADQQTAINALTAGEVDMTLSVNAADVDTLESNSDLNVVLHPSLSLDTCYFNFSRAPFDDVNARLAIEHARRPRGDERGVRVRAGHPGERGLPARLLGG